jgi:hypothetical protein
MRQPETSWMITYHSPVVGGWKQAPITRRGSRERSNGECGFPAQGATAVTTKAGGTRWLRRDGMMPGTVTAMTRQDATTTEIAKARLQDRVCRHCTARCREWRHPACGHCADTHSTASRRARADRGAVHLAPSSSSATRVDWKTRCQAWNRRCRMSAQDTGGSRVAPVAAGDGQRRTSRIASPHHIADDRQTIVMFPCLAKKSYAARSTIRDPASR